jgi:hypothetical protein
VGGLYIFPALLFVMLLFYGLVRGEFAYRGTVTQRVQEPVSYWLHVTFCVAVVAYCLYGVLSSQP